MRTQRREIKQFPSMITHLKIMKTREIATEDRNQAIDNVTMQKIEDRTALIS